MKINEMIEKLGLEVVTTTDKDCEITKVYCCDLLSFAMGKAPENGVWVTVMGNINSIAVATLTDVAFIILAEGASYDENAVEKAKTQNVCLLKTDLPVFEVAKMVDELINK